MLLQFVFLYLQVYKTINPFPFIVNECGKFNLCEGVDATIVQCGSTLLKLSLPIISTCFMSLYNSGTWLNCYIWYGFFFEYVYRCVVSIGAKYAIVLKYCFNNNVINFENNSRKFLFLGIFSRLPLRSKYVAMQ